MRAVIDNANNTEHVSLRDRDDMLPTSSIEPAALMKVHRALESLTPAQRAAICDTFGIENTSIRPDSASISVHPEALDGLVSQSLRALRRKPVA